MGRGTEAQRALGFMPELAGDWGVREVLLEEEALSSVMGLFRREKGNVSKFW